VLTRPAEDRQTLGWGAHRCIRDQYHRRVCVPGQRTARPRPTPRSRNSAAWHQRVRTSTGPP